MRRSSVRAGGYSALSVAREALAPWRCRAAILLAVLAAYLIPLWNAEFNEIDDPRFTYENEHIKQLDLRRAVRIFIDKTKLDAKLTVDDTGAGALRLDTRWGDVIPLVEPGSKISLKNCADTSIVLCGSFK